MLPSLGFQEILLLGILALVVVGPKDLPLLLRKLGRWTAKLRGMAQEFRTGFDELARQAELDELKKEVDALRRSNPISDISRELQRPMSTPVMTPLPPPHDVAHAALAPPEAQAEPPPEASAHEQIKIDAPSAESDNFSEPASTIEAEPLARSAS